MDETCQIGVSVYVLVYEQSWEKIKITLESLICQEGIDLEIVISDDGSKEKHFEEIRDYFEKNNFNAYKIVDSDINTGLVLNVSRALKKCEKKWVKEISPGDCLRGKNILLRWIEFLKKSGKRWSFSEVFPYKLINGEKTRVDYEIHPRAKEEYKKGEDDISRWNYLVKDDLAFGSAMLAERQLLEEYIKILEGRVVYAEDNMYRLMMFNGIVGSYYPNEAIYYEIGTGISTNGSEEWNKKISKDWKETNKIMNEIYDKTHDLIQRKILRKDNLPW